MVIIRRAARNNIPAIAELLTKAVERKQGYNDTSWGTEPFTYDEVSEMLDKFRVYIATINGAVTGIATVTNKDELWVDKAGPISAWYIHRMASHESVKGQNVGGQILDRLTEDAQRQGVTALRLDCFSENTGLRGYYKKQGFVEIEQKDLHNKLTGDTDHKTLFEKKIS